MGPIRLKSMQMEFQLSNGDKVSVKTEEWRELVGFPDYEVSSFGRFKNKKTGKELKGTVSNNGYIHIGPMLNGKQVTKLAHRLIAESFIENPGGPKMQVNHIDGNRANNWVSNLEWATNAANVQKAMDRKKQDQLALKVV